MDEILARPADAGTVPIELQNRGDGGARETGEYGRAPIALSDHRHKPAWPKPPTRRSAVRRWDRRRERARYRDCNICVRVVDVALQRGSVGGDERCANEATVVDATGTREAAGAYLECAELVTGARWRSRDLPPRGHLRVRSSGYHRADEDSKGNPANHVVAHCTSPRDGACLTSAALRLSSAVWRSASHVSNVQIDAKGGHDTVGPTLPISFYRGDCIGRAEYAHSPLGASMASGGPAGGLQTASVIGEREEVRLRPELDPAAIRRDGVRIDLLQTSGLASCHVVTHHPFARGVGRG